VISIHSLDGQARLKIRNGFNSVGKFDLIKSPKLIS